MTEGLLWFDANPKRDLADKVRGAAERYWRKFGLKPNICYVNPVLTNTPRQLGPVKVVPMRNVLPHHFWIGVDD